MFDVFFELRHVRAEVCHPHQYYHKPLLSTFILVAFVRERYNAEDQIGCACANFLHLGRRSRPATCFQYFPHSARKDRSSTEVTGVRLA